MASASTTYPQLSQTPMPGSLGAAFEWADQSIVLIDSQMCVRFVSLKARALWRLSIEQCESNPSFAEFIYDIAAAGAYDIGPDALEEFVLERFATVQSGDSRPVDIRVPGNRSCQSPLHGAARRIATPDSHRRNRSRPTCRALSGAGKFRLSHGSA